VVALGGEGGLSSRVAATGARVVHLHMRPGVASPLALWRLRRLMHDLQPHLIHGWMYHANVVAAVAAQATRFPVIWAIHHSLHALSGERPITRLVIKAGARMSARPAAVVYVARSSAMQHEQLGYRREKTRVIPNGFDSAQFRPDAQQRQRLRAEWRVAPNTLAIGLVARLHPIKDHDNFLRAAALFALQCPDAVFILVGDGLEVTNAELAERIATLGLTDRVRLCGRRNDMTAVNAAFDVASCSSWSESFPNAIGEAMACGVVCAATDVGDIRDIIGDTGVVVPARNPEALCDAWKQLAVLGEDGRRTLGERARHRVIERYSLATVTEQYETLYQQVIRG
ncbi:MAG TPA: glycosyltransferase, partial [Gemmatimonadaceae bacterium]